MFSTINTNSKSLTDLSTLIIEKSDFEITTIKKLLQQLGLETIEVAKNISQAKKLLKKGTFDLVFCEYELSNESGLELLKDLRLSNNFEPAFIIMTSNNSKETIVELLESVPDDILIKPFAASFFHMKVEKTIKSYKETKNIRKMMASNDYEAALKAVCDPRFDFLTLNNTHLSSWLEKKKIEIMMAQKRYDNVINHIEILLKSKKFDLESVRTCQIAALFEKKHYDEVIKKSIDCLSKHPLSIKSHIFLGHAYYEKGLITQSTKCYNQALRLSKRSIVAQRAVSKIFHEVGDYEKSIESYKRLIRLVEKSVEKKEEDYYGYANAKKESAELALKGDMNQTLTEAINIIKKGQFNFPNSLLLDVHEHVLDIQALVSVGKEKKAMKKMEIIKRDFEQVINRNGSALVNTLIAHQQLGNDHEVNKLKNIAKESKELKVSMNSLDKRMNSFKNIKAEDKRKIEELLKKADSLIENDNHGMAIQKLKEALDLSPKSITIAAHILETQLTTLEKKLTPLILEDCYKTCFYFKKFITTQAEKKQFIQYSKRIKRLIDIYNERRKTKNRKINYAVISAAKEAL